MNSRQRQLATLRHEIPDRISVDAIAIENQREIAELMGIEQSEVYAQLGIDGRIVAAGYTGELGTGPAGETLTEWGTISAGDYGTAHWYPLTDVTSVAEVKRHLWPDPRDHAFEQAGKTARVLAVNYAVRGPYWWPLFSRVCDLCGMEATMVLMAVYPKLFEALLENVFQRTAEYCRRLLEASGESMPILSLGDDFATQRGMMISPEHWRRFLKPRYAQLFDIGKRAGRFVWFHSCGDITPVLPDLIDIGVDVWETVQLHALSLSPGELKKEYGRHITFFGGINTQRLPFATLDEVRAEVRHCVETLGENGGYICGPDHHIKPDVPAANTVALFEAALAFQREGYTRLTVGP